MRKPGSYTKDTKVTVILAIELGDIRVPAGQIGSVENPRRWAQVEPINGTSTDDFNSFLDEVVLHDIGM